MLSTSGEGSPIADAVTSAFTATSALPAANEALFLPVLVTFPLTVYGLGWGNGATVTGNTDCGIYDSEGARLVSLGSTAQSGTSVIQTTSITALTLNPGRYYLALAADNNTALYRCNQTLAVSTVQRASGVAQQTSAFPLPATATFAACTTAVAFFVCAFVEGSTF